MNWYQGNIAEAVAMSKAKSAIFVVYVEGNDDLTGKLTNFINEDRIRSKLESEDFVAIKIASDSQAYMQFAKIYQMVPVPSIFFIGNSGAPLEIATGIIQSVDELEQKIEMVLAASGKSGSSSASASLIAAEQSTVESTMPTTSAAALKTELQSEEVVCEGDVCYKKPKEPQTTNTTEELKSAESANVEADKNRKLEETRKQLEEKRRERIEIEKKMEKERELQRRREGKEMQNLQSWQKEQELKELKNNIRRERLEEQAARDRILAQIAADRAERAQKFAADSETTANSTNNSPATNSAQATNNSGNARLQFRLSTGDCKTHSFDSQETLSTVRQFVKTELLSGTGIRDFILATTYPKREFNSEHDSQTLVELGLFPSAVILVITKESSSNPAAIIARSGGIVNILSTLFWALLSPVYAVFGYLRNLGGGRRGQGQGGNDEANAGAQKRANEERGAQHEAAKRRNLDRFMNGPSTSKDTGGESSPGAEGETSASKPYRRYVGESNIHRLTDQRKDSDDENATWNGNSTQQQ